MPSRYLITGCSGFIGSCLAESLVKSGKIVYGTFHQKALAVQGVRAVACDMRSRSSIQTLVAECKPDVIYHLAAQSGIMTSWQHPEDTFAINVYGTYYLLEVVKELKLNSRVIVFGSSSEYGSLEDDQKYHTEDAVPFRPGSPYALSKVAQDLMGRLYYEVFNMPIIRVLPFYIIGPRKEPDAPSDFAKAIVRFERGQMSELSVGNLNVVRDVVDVRDGITALRLIEEKGTPGLSYNLCSGRGTELQTILNGLLNISGSQLKVVVDSTKLRPGDNNRIVGNLERLRKLGWEPTFSLEETLTSILDYWRKAL